jgi:hypothetical protein
LLKTLIQGTRNVDEIYYFIKVAIVLADGVNSKFYPAGIELMNLILKLALCCLQNVVVCLHPTQYAMICRVRALSKESLVSLTNLRVLLLLMP